MGKRKRGFLTNDMNILEFVERSGDLDLLHRLAYPKCKIQHAHCHNKPCQCEGCK